MAILQAFCDLFNWDVCYSEFRHTEVPVYMHHDAYWFIHAAVIVEFGQTFYSVEEGDIANLIVVTNRVADRDMEVDLATFDGTTVCKWMNVVFILVNL